MHWRLKKPKSQAILIRHLSFAEWLSTGCRLIAEVLRALSNPLKTYNLQGHRYRVPRHADEFFCKPESCRVQWRAAMSIFFDQGNLPFPSINITSCIVPDKVYNFGPRPIRVRSRNGNRLKSFKNPIPTTGRQKVFVAATNTSSRPTYLNNRSPTTVLATFRKPLYDQLPNNQLPNKYCQRL